MKASTIIVLFLGLLCLALQAHGQEQPHGMSIHISMHKSRNHLLQSQYQKLEIYSEKNFTPIEEDHRGKENRSPIPKKFRFNLNYTCKLKNESTPAEKSITTMKIEISRSFKSKKDSHKKFSYAKQNYTKELNTA